MLFLRTIPGALSLGLIWGVMAIGLYISYKLLDFADLTVDGSFCTGGAVCVVLINAGVNVALALLLALVAGVVCGMITGLLNTACGIPPILAGILTQLALWSINIKILNNKANVSVANGKTVIVTIGDNLQTILVMLGVAAVIIGALYWFFGTQRGCSIRAVGCNEQMARAQGINVAVNKNVGLMISNGLVALAGALMSQYQGYADINMGRGAIVTGLAAIIIGLAVVSWLPDNFAIKVVGVALGAVVYFMVYQFIINLGLDMNLLKLLSAVLVALFLSAQYWKNKYWRARPRKSKAVIEPQGGEDNADIK